MHDRVLLDLNNPHFQEDLFSLEEADVNRVFVNVRKLRRLSWSEVYRDRVSRRELIQSEQGPGGARLCSLRLGDKFRAIVYRDGNFLRFLSPHPDHDPTYA